MATRSVQYLTLPPFSPIPLTPPLPSPSPTPTRVLPGPHLEGHTHRYESATPTGRVVGRRRNGRPPLKVSIHPVDDSVVTWAAIGRRGTGDRTSTQHRWPQNSAARVAVVQPRTGDRRTVCRGVRGGVRSLATTQCFYPPQLTMVHHERSRVPELSRRRPRYLACECGRL